MTVIFDLLGVQNRDHGERGIARYVANLALAIEADFGDLIDNYLVHPDLPIPGSINPLLSSGKVISAKEVGHPALSPTAGGVFICGSLFELEQPLGRVLPAWARSARWRRTAVLYDLIPLRFASHYLSEPSLRSRYQTRVQALKMFDHLLAISEASASDAVELAEIASHAVSAIGAGADTQFRPPSTSQSEVASRLIQSGRYPGLETEFVLFPTGFDFRKNIDGFVHAYAALDPRLRRRHQLVMMCGLNPDQSAYMGELMSKVGLSKEELILTGRVSDEELVDLNQAAHLVVFPSLYEGFGLPVLEARQCGAAVICGDNSSLREVQPDQDARFDASSTASMTAALTRVLNTEGEVSRLRNLEIPQFSWADSAAATASVVASLQATAVPSPLPRLAVISPVPPQQSGIATYAVRMIEHLQHYADVTVFTESLHDEDDDHAADEGTIRTLFPAAGTVEVRPLNQLGPMIDGGGAFDELIYFMGNSRYHAGALSALQKHPGVVLFHDVRLSGLYGECVRMGVGGVSSVGEELARMYPGRYRSSLEDSQVISADDAARFGVLMCADVARSGTKVLVHSPYAATLVGLDCGETAEVCFPLPAPALDQPDSPSEDLVINSFGVVDPAKMPESIIEAVAAVRAAYTNIRLNFVGPVDPGYRRELNVLIDGLDLADIVSFTGHLSQSEFGAAQRSSTIAVQLRSQSNGESSAAVAELMAAGVPTVVSDLGSMSDLPDEIVVKIRTKNTSSELARVILDLAREPESRADLSANAQAWAAENSFEAAAARLAEMLFGNYSG